MDITDISIDTKSLNNKLARIEGWILTYYLPPFDGSGGIGGPVATYWASSPYMVGPYVMNSYGTLKGLCKRALYIKNDNSVSYIKKRIDNHLEYYLKSQDPTTGIFTCSWGEDPFVGIGLIQQTSVVEALWDVYGLYKYSEAKNAAIKGKKTYFKYHQIEKDWSVYNQALRTFQSLIAEKKANGFEKFSNKEYKLVKKYINIIIKEQHSERDFLNGAIPQSFSDYRIILPYQGKCLYPLLAIYEFTNDYITLDIAKRLADFIMRVMNIFSVNLVSGVFYPKRKYNYLYKYLYRLRYLLPSSEPFLRKINRNAIVDWNFISFPQWIARSAETARGFWKLYLITNEKKYLKSAFNIIKKILEFQTPLGGIRNTIGFINNPKCEKPVWQDIVAVPRWNSYVVQLLHELLKDEPLLKPNRSSKNVKDKVYTRNGECLVEDIDNLILFNKNKEIIWKIKKGERWGKPFRKIGKWNEEAPVRSS